MSAIFDHHRHASELFASVPNTAAGDPSNFWSEELKKAPFPTNSFWLNYVLKDGSQPEYIHPYLVQSKPGAFTICYPARIVSPAFIIQAFTQDITISHGRGNVPHVISHYDDLSVTLEVPGKRLKVPLVRGSPYVTLVFKGGISSSNYEPVTISTIHAILELTSSPDNTKHRLVLNNRQTWCIYSSSAMEIFKDGVSAVRSKRPFSGALRLALVPRPESEGVLDTFSGRYPVRGHATFDRPFSMGFEWKSRGRGELLMLCLPMHKEIMASPSLSTCRVSNLVYSSIDGSLEGVVGDKWSLEPRSVSSAWYSDCGISDSFARDQIKHALDRDVHELSQITTNSSYFYGKAAARAARMALIAEEVGHYGVIPKLRSFLDEAVTPWLDGSFARNGIVFDAKWGGLVSREGARDPGADFGNGVYNDHHYHWGYFVYAGAVLAKIDNAWARKYRDHIYTLVGDYMTFRKEGSNFPRLRCFDLWLMHSWAGGLTEFADGRNQESTSEAVNAYYSAALLGMAFGDVGLINHGLTLAALEIHAAKSLWFIPSSSDSSIYEEEFARDNRVIGVLWANKRDTGLWFAPAESRECRVGIQVLPLTPITEKLFDDKGFVREVVQWTWPRVELADVADGWKGFAYALEAVSGDSKAALKNTLALKGHDDGNSLSNMLWWISTRPPC
ncbi:hypothetical protein SELMODRAFT_100942 [Selaginella moellendorffii]|uniref:glucan endo-1,3-beta-D-glucosidase n=1 Tax=Selaginella moellendorffii TaxID=88036 RepID=D8RTC9_SELML|nr:probable endo-1,3(4)-beta-glucanase ARB_01444 [Selaginella moellendorffii]EFJ24486.1 hypothetical protein SELMODRAFT_100942 [Selaginella moellendorffii]|eukprot:XP_002974264.1 probable endo-1,3(4)-beta-glucanase ARB_01444 [Selaginella moellendorffii]